MSSVAESQLTIIITSLLDSLNDKNEQVIFSVEAAIKNISQKYPNEILQTICDYRRKNAQKILQEHLLRLFSLLEYICQSNLLEIDGDSVILLIDFCVNEMMKSEENSSLMFLTANILVAIGRKHCIQVMESLEKQLKVGQFPHLSVPYTMANLSESNAFATMQFLPSILQKLLPNLKAENILSYRISENVRQTFAQTFCKFAEATLEYFSNLQRSPDSTLDQSIFYNSFDIIFDWLLQGLHSRDQKTLESSLQSIGAVFLVVSPKKQEENCQKLVVLLLQICRKQHKDLSLTAGQSFGNVLSVAVSNNHAFVEQQFVEILQVLTDCLQPGNYNKTQAEILRCFDHLTKHSLDKLIDFLIALMKNNEKDKTKSLTVVTHLVNSTNSEIKLRSNDLITMLKSLLNDQHLHVQKALLKAFVAFAFRGYFYDYEDCKMFIEFIVKLSTLAEKTDSDLIELVKNCENSLIFLTTSVLELELIFWKIFHECLLNKNYQISINVLLKCLANLASRRNLLEDSTEVKSIEVFVRCIVLLSCPENRYFILKFLKNYSEIIYPNIKRIFDSEIEKFLQSKNILTEDEILNFLLQILHNVEDLNWKKNLATKFINQLPMYLGKEKFFCFNCIAVILGEISDEKFVKSNLDILLLNSKFNSNEDAKKIAKSIGLCSKNHSTIILQKLKFIREEELVKKTNKFFNFIKDGKHEVEMEKLRYTIISCYCELIFQAPVEKILPIVESEILNWIVKELSQTKEQNIRKICIFAIGKISDALNLRNSLHVHLKSRDELLTIISRQMQLHSGGEFIELFPIILPTLNSLVILRNDLESEQRIAILRIVFDNVYNGSAIYCKLQEQENQITYGDLKLGIFISNSFNLVNQLTENLLKQNLNPATLDDIITHLEPWLNKKKVEQRFPAIENLKNVLSFYLQNMQFAYETPSKFGQTGFILGRLVPRITDPIVLVRKVALECVASILCIAARFEGHTIDFNRQITEQILSLQSNLSTTNLTDLIKSAVHFSQVTTVFLPPFQQFHFVESTLDALQDPESLSSVGACAVLIKFLELKGPELYQNVLEVLNKLLYLLSMIQCENTKHSALKLILPLAEHHLKIVVTTLLIKELPYDSHICECWQMLSQNEVIFKDTLEQLKRLFNTLPLYEDNSLEQLKRFCNTLPLYEDNSQSDKTRFCNLQPLAATFALRELLHTCHHYNFLVEEFPELFVQLLMIFAGYIGVTCYVFTKTKSASPPPAQIALECLKLLLMAAKKQQVAEVFLQDSNLDSDSTIVPFLNLMPSLASSLFMFTPLSIPKIIQCLNSFCTSSIPNQRIVVFAFFAEVTAQRPTLDPILVEAVVANLMVANGDISGNVRQLALRGLGHVNVPKMSVLTALVHGLDDRETVQETDSPIALEAIKSLSTYLSHHYLEEVSLLISASVRLRPFFTHQNSEVRSCAFQLFGDLALSVSNTIFSKNHTKEDLENSNLAAFREQVESSFIGMLLHLADDEQTVVKACKYALKQSTPLLQAKRVNTMIQDHLIDEAQLNFIIFVKDLVKCIAEDLPDRLSFFTMTTLPHLKSSWSGIRANACFLVGVLFNAGEKQNNSEIDAIAYRLMQALKDEDEKVRDKAVLGLSYLFVNF